MSAVRALLSKATPSLARLASTADALKGAEKLILTSGRASLQSSYADLFSQNTTIVATSVNTSIPNLEACNFFEDKSRDNDISHYKVGRGKKGVDEETGEEYAWETQGTGYPFAIPRQLVSHGEKQAFTGCLIGFAVENALSAKGSGEGLVGASIFFEESIENVESQIKYAVKKGPDCLVIENCDSAEGLEALKEILERNKPRMERLGTINLTGGFIKDEQDTEVGFDIPAVLVKGDEVVEVI